MLRCGQMLLGETMLRLETAAAGGAGAADEDAIRRGVVAQFADVPSAPYSIHNVALRGHKMDKKVGAWFGPNCMAQVMKSLADDVVAGGAGGAAAGSGDGRADFVVHVAMNACLATNEVEQLCGSGGGWRPVLLLVPLRLGMDKINKEYSDELVRIFTFPESVGAIGGRPNAAFYFAGTIESDLLYLDPHILQLTTGPVEELTSLETYCRDGVERLPLSGADPSLTIGFLCRTRGEFDALLGRLQVQPAGDATTPLFVVQADSLSAYDAGGGGGAGEGGDGDDGVDSDGFELL